MVFVAGGVLGNVFVTGGLVDHGSVDAFPCFSFAFSCFALVLAVFRLLFLCFALVFHRWLLVLLKMRDQ